MSHAEGCPPNSLPSADGMSNARCDPICVARASQLMREALALLGTSSAERGIAPRPSPDRLVRISEVQRLTGLKRSAIYEQMQRGTFPRSVKVGARTTAWSEVAIHLWVAEKVGPSL